ncbi:hypothetical protein [Chondrinema litorale]|uniref:hypothetical protein n=1 Tax=Chondrinema litorale TaxID=2994555 RepID=UPI0025434331|nr:hypothetical protein [Chondrinema litorale]UZR97613.1 hypothetical protein OQ292_26685 [Chondrinema litorale]
MELQGKTLEMVIFKTKTGVSTEAAQIAMRKLNTVLDEFKGYLQRFTAVAEDGEFIDLVFWDNLDYAMQANKAVMKNEEALESFGLIDDQSMQCRHFEIFNSVKASSKV